MAHQHLIHSLKKLYDMVITEVGTIKFNKKHPQQLTAMLLFGTIIEISSGCITLLEASNYTSVFILSRNLLEAYADLVNTVDDIEYIKTMGAAYLKEKLDLAKNAKKSEGRNPFLKALFDQPDLDKEIEDLKQELSKLKKKNYKPLKVSERLKKANLSNEYRSMYNLMCSHSHNNLSALELRHIDKQNDEYAVTFFKEMPQERLSPYIDAIAATLFFSVQKIHNLLSIKKDHFSNKLDKSFSDLRSIYYKP